jgi:hypothetical protein
MSTVLKIFIFLAFKAQFGEQSSVVCLFVASFSVAIAPKGLKFRFIGMQT